MRNEKRKLYLEEHPTKANGYYTSDILTLAGSLEDLRVPRRRKGNLHPKILPISAALPSSFFGANYIC